LERGAGGSSNLAKGAANFYKKFRLSQSRANLSVGDAATNFFGQRSIPAYQRFNSLRRPPAPIAFAPAPFYPFRPYLDETLIRRLSDLTPD
jgi:hypothetical protein